MSKYLQYYKDIFNGKPFLRNGEEITINQKVVFDGGGIMMIYDELDYEIDRRGAANILDFGCGTSVHWHMDVPIRGKRTQSATEYFGKKLRGFYRYDPAHPEYHIKPTGKFDIIMCTEVLEHIPMEEMHDILTEMASYLVEDGIVILTIPKGLSSNSFPDGQNTHTTLMSTKEWHDLLDQYFKQYTLLHHGQE
jgi:2-polyprenyl-3-methyl-5-hydroxy-6-metoxy-1,4-benzoquinol methylase